MNGRIYDPQLGRFLSADAVIDGALNLQGYNRYSYVGNNPLKYSDPSGHFAQMFIGFAIGAAGDVGIQIMTNLATGKDWNDISVTSALISGAANTMGLGTIKLAKNFNDARKAYKAVKASKILIESSKKSEIVIKTVTEYAKFVTKQEVKETVAEAVVGSVAVQATKFVAGEIEDTIKSETPQQEAPQQEAPQQEAPQQEAIPSSSEDEEEKQPPPPPPAFTHSIKFR